LLPTWGAFLQALPATIRDQSVELFHVVEGALVKYLKTRLLLCVIRDALGRAVAYFTFGSYALPIGPRFVATIIPVLRAFLGAVPTVLVVLFSGGLEGGILVALFLLLVQQLEGNVLVSRIMGSFVSVHLLLVLFATLRGMLLFERRQQAPVMEVVVESAPRVAASGEEPAGLRGCSAGGEG